MIGVRSLTVERIRLRPDALDGRVAVVTGGGRGIGRAIVRTLASLGASVVIAERSDEGLETEQIVQKSAEQALFIRADVSLAADVAQLACSAQRAFGPVDILINNAAFCPVTPLIDTDVSLWDTVLATNLRGAFLTCKAFLPGMLARSRGTIVNMVWADALPYLPASVAASQGLVGLTKSLAAELARTGVQVIGFEPGLVDTPGLRSIAQGLASHLGLGAEELSDGALDDAYETLMPADRAAAAVAYLVAILADEYKGQIVTGQAVLERAGLTEPVDSQVECRLAPAPQTDDIGIPRLAASLSERVQCMIAETEAEFNRVPVCLRPLLRLDFEKKSGQSIRAWRNAAASLTDLLCASESSDDGVLAALRATYPSLRRSMFRLIGYYQQAPVALASLTGDHSALRDVTHLAPQRVTSLQFLIAELDRMLARHHA